MNVIFGDFDDFWQSDQLIANNLALVNKIKMYLVRARIFTTKLSSGGPILCSSFASEVKKLFHQLNDPA
jgi:hypothetical protein